MLVTLFMARSGSKLLMELLNGSDAVREFGEVFHERAKNFRHERNVWRALNEISHYPVPHPGFQFRYPRHPREFPEIDNALWSWLRPKITYVHLQRTDPIRGAISQQNAERLKGISGSAHSRNNMPPHDFPPLELNVERAIAEAQERMRLDAYYKSLITECQSSIFLTYEELSKNPIDSVNRVLREIGSPPLAGLPAITLTKTTSINLHDALSNYDTLLQKLIFYPDILALHEGIFHD